jgi:hypothetical protein
VDAESHGVTSGAGVGRVAPTLPRGPGGGAAGGQLVSRTSTCSCSAL